MNQVPTSADRSSPTRETRALARIRRKLRTWLTRRGVLRWWTRHGLPRWIARLARSDWLLGLAFTLANVLLSAWLGTLLSASDQDNRSQLAVIAGWIVLIVGLGSLAAALLGWRRRGKLRSEAGTAYLVKEHGRAWDAVDDSDFETLLTNRFDATIRVAGPRTTDAGWTWGLDEREGPAWDDQVDRLVDAVHISNSLDRPGSPNVLFVWCHWPVALELGRRLRQKHRGFGFSIGQRPSFGNQGDLYPKGRPEHALSFEDAPRGSTAQLQKMPAYRVPLRLTSEAAASAPSERNESPMGGPVLLLVRMTKGGFGDPPTVAPGTSPGPQPLKVTSLQIAACSGDPQLGNALAQAAANGTIEVRELQSVASGSHDFRTFPALAHAILEWLRTQVRANPHVTYLLGCNAPQELVLGMGKLLSREARGDASAGVRLWPLVSDGAPILTSVNVEIRIA